MANNPQFPSTQPHPPPNIVSMDPPRSFVPSMSFQFRPVVPAQQPQQFIPVASQHFRPVAHGVTVMNPGLPSQPPQPQFSPMVQQLPARPGQLGHIPPLPQAMTVSSAQPNRPIISGAPLPPPNIQTPNSYTPGLGGAGAPLSSTYSFAPSSAQLPMPVNAVAQYQPVTQMSASGVPAGGQVGSSVSQGTASVAPMQQTSEQPSVATVTAPAASIQPKTEVAVTDWIEHTSAEGRRYYFNKRTRQSSWEKPFELMTPIERADATTDWKEFTSPDGRKYYYNKVTKQSKWSIPEELKIAREQVEKAAAKGPQSEVCSNGISAVSSSVVKGPSASDAPSDTAHGIASSPVPVAPVFTASNMQPAMISGLAASPAVATSPATASSPTIASSVLANTDGVNMTVDTIKQPSDIGSENEGAGVAVVNTVLALTDDSSTVSVQGGSSTDGAPVQDGEETEKGVVNTEKVNNALEEKAIDQEPVTYTNKLEAKNAFKALLESANVGSDWTWEQAMRIIINDRRYGALRTLGERKQAFNEFLSQKKKQEAEERRNKQKKAREEYKKMLEESMELTSSTRWSKAVTMFEDDERFKAVERERDRRDLFENYVDELREKERVKAQEERRRNILEYRKFLESCDFIKASSQWRKVQDRLEADERCSRLEKIDRLEIFQEYLRDLEREEEEQRKIQKEELRKAERKNRDEFRKLMEGDVTAGNLTAKTHWRDYCMKVKDLPAYLAVASNTSGATPKDLFEDVAEELQKQYHEDKSRVKDAVKLRKITLASTWTLEDLKEAILDDISSPAISDINLKLIFDELLVRAKEKEEKEAKKRKRLADELFSLLHSLKEITASSTWEDCRHLVESSQECSSIGDESFQREIFEEYIMQLKEEAKENERKRREEKGKKEKEKEERERRKAKHGREKERGRDREKDLIKKDGADSDADMIDVHVTDENKRSSKDSDKKHRKRHQSSLDTSNENEKDHTRSSHKHSSDRKKSRRHASTPESDIESRHKRHKKDHRNGSHKSGDHDHEELEDGEFGEDRESR